MKFFDQKEEVLDIQLTQYGRHRLSKGHWKPEYYAFFDDNVLYDGGYGGVTEAKNVMPLSLGTSKLDSTKTPAMIVQFLAGQINEFENNFTGSLQVSTQPTESTPAHQLLHIPQVETDVEFQISVVDPSNPQVRFEPDPALNSGRTYADGTKVLIGPEQILLFVEEENASFDYKNFDIEVFEMTEQSGAVGEQVLTPLSFVKPLEMVENGILIDKRQAEIKAGRIDGRPPELDPTFVEYYFNINVDDAIDENVICAAISQIKSKNLIVDVGLNCPDLVRPISANIYDSDAIDEECLDI